MLKCLEVKPFDKITVTDIWKTSSVGRSTFYRLFDNTSDVLEYLCDQIFETLNEKHPIDETLNTNDLALRFIEIWMEHKTLLKAIVDSNRMDLLYNAHKKYLLPSKDIFFTNEQLNSFESEYLVATLTSCISAYLTTWIKHGCKEDSQTLFIQLKKCFSILGNMFD
ncbi:hypothetical protein [Intestinibacter sp.]|uniref:hypothetical protein n=1 Tax=Intestinibacter sp. TaxID=1965304 RepID=UPI003F17360B